MKVLLFGEEKAPFPIKAEDAEAALKTEYIQLVPGSRDNEGRQARAPNCFFSPCDCLSVCVSLDQVFLPFVVTCIDVREG